MAAAAGPQVSIAEVMPGIEEALRSAGLEILGSCEGFARSNPDLLRSAMFENFSLDEAETLGTVMLRVRAQPTQTLISEGTTGL